MVSCVRGEKRRKKGKECVRLTCGSKERNWESGISSFLSLKLILGVDSGRELGKVGVGCLVDLGGALIDRVVDTQAGQAVGW